MLEAPPKCSRCKIGSFAVYGPAFTDSPQTICKQRIETTTYRARQIILRSGERPSRVFTLYSGWACRFMQFPDGRRQILSFLLPGDSIVVEGLCAEASPLPFAVRAITNVSLCAFQISAMRRVVLATDRNLDTFTRTVLAQMTSMDRRLADVGRRRAIGRLAQLILDIEARLDQRGLVHEGEFDFPLRQDDIADALGLTVAHVNRTLVGLRKAGLIAPGRGKLRVLDRTRLQQIAVDE
ncbi:MAG TPA: Crp/Fnr family transcriptional regulator [Caulobacterales bacterium]|nr:Crp/Fnr family transcriptional regulator [Caulobacterales bacterium]